MAIISIYGVVGLVGPALLCWLTTKGLLRDDGEYEEWSSKLEHGWSQKLAMCPFRCVHCRNNDDDDDDEDGEDGDEEENWDTAHYFENEDGTINKEWLWNHLERNNQKHQEAKRIIEKQGEIINIILRRLQYGRW